MNIQQALREVLKQQNISQDKLGARIGLGRGAVGQRLRNGDLRIETVLKMLSALDYELVIQPRSGAKKPNGAFSIERKS